MNIQEIRDRHLRDDGVQRTMYEGHILVDLARLCDEVERLNKVAASRDEDAVVADIVDWLRQAAEVYSQADLLSGMYAVTWRIIADLIEQREYVERKGLRGDEEG